MKLTDWVLVLYLSISLCSVYKTVVRTPVIKNSFQTTNHTSRMIILDDQAHQQMTLHFQLSLQCNVSPITGFVRHTGWPQCHVGIPNNLHASTNHSHLLRIYLIEHSLSLWKRSKKALIIIKLLRSVFTHILWSWQVSLECCCDPIRIVNALHCLTGYQLTDNGLSKTTRVMTINQCQSIVNGEAIWRLWCTLVLCGLREMANQYGRGVLLPLGLSRFHRVTHFRALQVA